MTMATDHAAGKSLFKRYTEEIMIPTAVNLKKHLSAIEASGDPDAHDGDQQAHILVQYSGCEVVTL